MKFISVFLTLGFFVGSASQAADLCTPIELEHPIIKERARIVHFPDDRSVTLLGHNHGDRQDLKKFANWAKEPDPELTNQEWQERIGKFIKQNNKTLTHVKQDLGFLRAQLWETSQPIFLAVESQDEDMAAHATRAIGVHTALSKEFWRRDMEDTRLLRDAELIAMGGVLYSYLYDSELKDKYELVGMEGTEEGIKLQKTGKKKMAIAKNRLANILANQQLDIEKTNKAMAFVVNEMNKAYDDIANILIYDHQYIRARLLNAYPAIDNKAKGEVLAYLYGYLDYLRGMKKRDVFFSRKLAIQERSSIFFVGEEHLTSLANLLQVQCNEVRAGNPIHLNVEEQPEIEEM